MDKLICLLNIIFGITSLFSFVGHVEGKDICYVYGSVYTYCDDGYYCCEDDTKCCPHRISVGAIVGMVIAGIFMLTICAICAMFVLKKHHTRPNQVVRPSTINNNQTVAVVGGPMYPYNPQMNGYQPQQYPYGQPVQPPPYAATAPDTAPPCYPPPPQYNPNL